MRCCLHMKENSVRPKKAFFSFFVFFLDAFCANNASSRHKTDSAAADPAVSQPTTTSLFFSLSHMSVNSERFSSGSMSKSVHWVVL